VRKQLLSAMTWYLCFTWRLQIHSTKSAVKLVPLLLPILISSKKKKKKKKTRRFQMFDIELVLFLVLKIKAVFRIIPAVYLENGITMKIV
jgi:hypothetical protein